MNILLIVKRINQIDCNCFLFSANIKYESIQDNKINLKNKNIYKAPQTNLKITTITPKVNRIYKY